MESFKELFDKDIVESISTLVEKKMSILEDVQDFKEKDKKLAFCMEDLENALPDELREKYDEVMRLMYQTEDYYFTLAYLLGAKYGEKMGKI